MDLKKSEKMTNSPRAQGLFITQEPQDEEASDCPLLTPSPPAGNTPDPLDNVTMFNPLEGTPLEMTPTPTLDNFNADDGLKAFMSIVNSHQKHENDEPSSRDPMVESSSSEESSITKEPVCTQLLTQVNTAFQHLAPDAQAVFCNQEASGKPPLVGIQLIVPKPQKDYSFTRWNWTRIRQACFWLMVCGLVLSTGLVVRGIVSMPKKCAPSTEWWQGKLFYEIFPASFQESSKSHRHGIGDFRGIKMRLNYLRGLGVKAVRLNSIFSSSSYPENYKSITSLTRIDENLGSMEDFDELIDALHSNGMTLVLDFPLHPFVDELRGGLIDRKEVKIPGNDKIEGRRKRSADNSTTIGTTSSSTTESSINMSTSASKNMTNVPRFEKYEASNFVDPSQAEHEITKALKYWLHKRVDGFYLKGLEHYVNDTHFVNLLMDWRDIVGYGKILMSSWRALEAAKTDIIKDTILKTMDLVDVALDLSKGIGDIKRQFEVVVKSDLLKLEWYHPWVHWSIGSIETDRLASRLAVKNASVAATMLAMMLPGTPSIFYGDEIGMRNCLCDDHRDLDHLHNLSPMAWEIVKHSDENFSSSNLLTWLPHSDKIVQNNMGDAIMIMSRLRQLTTPIFVETAVKHNHVKVNCDFRYADDEIIVMERWYPRQSNYVLVANFGNVTRTRDLSSLYYNGYVMIGPRDKLNQGIYFKEFTIAPGEAFLINIDK